ncbi:hypothetical protein DWX02_04920 [Parabacteroides distasonis]|nr:hypothetical protein DWX02_04920 [Parabacteroides distasonis]RKU52853.1 hypothetical protein DWX33_20195 [Parabacteroides sp. AF19-14]
MGLHVAVDLIVVVSVEPIVVIIVVTHVERVALGLNQRNGGSDIFNIRTAAFEFCVAIKENVYEKK